MFNKTTLRHILISVSEIEDRGITFLFKKDHEEYLTYKELFNKARKVLYDLQSRGIKPKDELVFQVDNNLEFISIFWACILGGIIPVPITKGNTFEYKLKVLKILNVLNNPFLVTDSKWFGELMEFDKANNTGFDRGIDKKNTILVDEIELNLEGEIYEGEKDDIAFIQFSSGSTGDPKGVILTHYNLVTNINAIIKGTGMTSEDSTFSWMPLTHDMGLIALHLTSVGAEINQYIMSTALFVRRPILWMSRINHYKATMTCSPNFGYKYLLSSLKKKKDIDWDLSNLRAIFNGAEPISIELCDQFNEEMEKYNLKSNAMTPVYGMAEACVAVTFSDVNEHFKAVRLSRKSLGVGQKVVEVDLNEDNNSIMFADVGQSVQDCFIRICNEHGEELGDREIGYIEMKGKNVTGGYYNNEEATLKVTRGDGWINTGDLGVKIDGNLIITGRTKDVIFVNGQNFYAHDFERIAEEVENVKYGKVIAAGVYDKLAQKEKAILFVNYKKKLEDFLNLRFQIKKHINQNCGVYIDEVIPVKQIPKTTSGKLERFKMMKKYEDGEFDSVIAEIHQLKESLEHQQEIENDYIDKKVIEICRDVLDLEEFELNSDFFECGGDSLKGNVLLNRLCKEFEVEIPITELFYRTTARDIAEFIKGRQKVQRERIERAPKMEYYELSSAQKRMYILNHYKEIGTAYNSSLALRIKGSLDSERLDKAIHGLIERHEILRTSFKSVNGEPLQEIHDQWNFNITHFQGKEEEIDSIIEKFIIPFDMRQSNLIRVGLIKLSEEEFILIFDMNHIVTDGTSMGILLNDFIEIYKGNELKPLRVQYKDFVQWQNKRNESAEVIKQREYWLNRFKGKTYATNIPTDYLREEVRGFQGSIQKFEIEDGVLDKIKDLSNRSGTTLYMILLSVYNVLLFKYSGERDIITGSPIACRNNSDLENMIGIFVNSIPMRNSVNKDESFNDLLRRVKVNSIEAYKNQEYQFEDLVERINLVRDGNRNPMFDTMCVLQNMYIPSLNIDGIEINEYEIQNKTTVFDLIFYFMEFKGKLEFKIQFSTELFRKETIEWLGNSYIKILKDVIKNTDIAIGDLETELREESKKKNDFKIDFKI